MLLIGMWMSLTKKPMNPMMANPMAVAMAIFWYSERNEWLVWNENKNNKPFLSGLVHLLTRRYESFENWRAGSIKAWNWSMVFTERNTDDNEAFRRQTSEKLKIFRKFNKDTRNHSGKTEETRRDERNIKSAHAHWCRVAVDEKPSEWSVETQTLPYAKLQVRCAGE